MKNIIILMIFWLLSNSIIAYQIQQPADIQTPLDASFYLKSKLNNVNSSEEQLSNLTYYYVEQFTNALEIEKAFSIILELPKELAYLKKPLYSTLFITYLNKTTAQDTVVLLSSIDENLQLFVNEQCFDYCLRNNRLADSLVFLNATQQPILYSRMAAQLIGIYKSTKLILRKT